MYFASRWTWFLLVFTLGNLCNLGALCIWQPLFGVSLSPALAALTWKSGHYFYISPGIRTHSFGVCDGFRHGSIFCTLVDIGYSSCVSH